MKAWGGLKAAGLVALVLGVVLVPLYGDPHRSPVSQAEWARMLLKALEMDAYLPASARASDVFGILTWNNTLQYSADRYLRADGVEERTIDGKLVLAATSSTPAEVAYPVTVVRGGNYELRMRAKGSQPVGVEIERSGEAKPAGSFHAEPNPEGGWVSAGKAHLDPGSYVASISLPPGAVLQNVEVVPPCVEAVEPPGGWRAASVATTADVAVTVVKALDRESDLPAAAAVVEAAGTDFQVMNPAATQARSSVGAEGPVAGPSGLKVMAFVELPEAGLYTVSVLGVEGQGQSWLGDGCQKAVLCPSQGKAAGAGPQWRVLQTAKFSAGRHFFSVTLGGGASITRLRLEQRRTDNRDYIETVTRLGLDLGPDGPITRERAIAAMKFVQTRRNVLLGASCGDVTPTVDTLIAQSGSGGLPTPPGGVVGPPGPPPPPGGTGSGTPPLAPPAVPPQIPASPVTP
jgi:hypothetical protein